MKNDTSPQNLHSIQVKPLLYILALLINVLIIVVIALVYRNSVSSYSEQLFDENIKNVESLNIASANAAYTYSNGMGESIDNSVSFIESMGYSYRQAIDYLGQSNTSVDKQYQIILSGSYGDKNTLSYGDYSGISIRKLHNVRGALYTMETEIKYGSGYYDIFKAFTDVNDKQYHGVCFAPEFTNADTKQKSFAVYRHIVLKNDAGENALYTVLLVVDSKTAFAAFNLQQKYEGQSTVLINSSGDYIIKNSDYRNANFFDYIVNYNDLTLDWREQLQATALTATSDGSCLNLFYKNHQGDDCVFSLSVMPNGWYSITCVPLSSFNLDDNSINYSLIILMAFLALFIVDGFAIYFVGRTMSYNIHVAEKAKKAAINANQAKSRFLSTMSHELRTPLNAIIGLAALSSDSIDDPTVLKDYLKKIDISSKLLLQLISDILDVSAIESNKLRLNKSEFDVTKLISSMSAIYYDQCAAKGIEFRVVLKNMHSETLIGDSVRVNQVLLNFLSNAVKFTPSGGKVTLSAEQTAKEDRHVTIRFTISDTGCGISDELKNRLFQPFERASGDEARKFSGSGLGLSISKNLTMLMNGTVGFNSTKDVGSDFWAEIPFEIPEKTSKRAFSPIEHQRCVVAMSDKDEREYIGQILAGFGVEHVLVDSAQKALEQIRESASDKQPINLCLVDWKLSDLSGFDTSTRIRSEFGYRSIHIVLLSYEIIEAGNVCSKSGADAVLGKPIFPSALFNTLEEVISDQVRSPIVLSKSYDLSGMTVLLVEDNKLNTEIATLLLDKVGVTVECVEDGKLGFERFAASENGHFDAILMDIQMPVMDGYRSTAAIRGCSHPQAKTIPIIAMTADAFTDDVKKAADAGMDEHVAKPVVPETLYATLKKYMR